MEGVTFYEIMLESEIYKAYGEGGKGKPADSEVIVTLAVATVSEKNIGKKDLLLEMKTFRIRTNSEPFCSIIPFFHGRVKTKSGII